MHACSRGDLRLCQAVSSRGRDHEIDRRLIRNREFIECRQCGFQVLAFSQLERVEAAAGQVEQLLALDVADGAQLARELETPAENLRLAVATTLANGAELNRNQRDSQKVVLQLRYRIGRTQADSQPAIPQPPLLAF